MNNFPPGDRVLVLDGAMFTLRMQTGLDAAAVHHAYLDAGAAIIRTDTFAAVSDAAAHAAAQTARAATADHARRTSRPRAMVAGVIGIGVTGLDGLLAGGVDLLLAETLTSTSHIDAVLAAVSRRRRAPRLMLSVAVTPAGRLVSGQPIDDVTRAIAGAPVWSIGLNCGAGIDALSAPLATLASRCECRVSCAPAAGLPDAFGEYDELASLAPFLRDVAVAGLVDVVGGCCGTTPAAIAEIAGAVAGLPARMAGFRE